jgi:succinate-acetate transporter protein
VVVPLFEEESVSTEISDRPVAAAVQQIADPGPLGLAAFAMTTFVLNVFNTNLVNSKLDAAVLPLALFYGGLAQLLAGMWEFRKGNTFGATAFTSFGAFWLSFYWLITYDAAHLTTPAGDAHKAIGVFLLGWAIFTLYMTVAAMRTSGAVLAVFVALTLTFILLALGKFASPGNTATNFTKIGGWVGLVTAALAWYASFAGVTNATWGRSVFPTWPRTTPVALSRGPVR